MLVTVVDGAGVHSRAWLSRAAADRVRHEAAADRVRNERLGIALAQWEAEDGSFTEEELAEARQDLGLPPMTPGTGA